MISTIVVCRQKQRCTQQDDLIRCFNKFVEYQSTSRKEFLAMEERRLQREEDMEAKRRREDWEHELRLFQLIAGGLGSYSFPFSGPSYPSGQGDYMPEDTE